MQIISSTDHLRTGMCTCIHVRTCMSVYECLCMDLTLNPALPSPLIVIKDHFCSLEKMSVGLTVLCNYFYKRIDSSRTKDLATPLFLNLGRL